MNDQRTATIVWFRHDLRLDDNPALLAAIDRGGPIIPVYLWCPQEEGDWPPGGASRWWLHQSLAALAAELPRRGSRLIVRSGDATNSPPTAGGPRRPPAPPARPAGALDLLRALLRETGATAVFWNRRYEPAAVARDSTVKAELLADGVNVASFNGNLLFEPWVIANQEGKPMRVFTPYWRRCLALDAPPDPRGAPPTLKAPSTWPASMPLADLHLEPTRNWAGGLRAAWQPGERGALRQLDRFTREAVAAYAGERDRPDRVGTSRLSPYLHFGELSPRRAWHAARNAPTAGTDSKHRAQVGPPQDRDKAEPRRGGEVFLRELGWREFAHHLLYHFPHTPREPLRSEFASFPWRADAATLNAWQHGRTGYPLVDAGMRELWVTGWMHNRVRMVVASFLVKHLLLPWQAGAAWFWDTLVDADLANNTLGWQWSAGCGADAAPYFRVFNPILQGEKFDPTGDYVRRWLPELAKLPPHVIQRPWEAEPLALADAGVALGETYPRPIVDHARGRERALAAFETIKS